MHRIQEVARRLVIAKQIAHGADISGAIGTHPHLQHAGLRQIAEGQDEAEEHPGEQAQGGGREQRDDKGRNTAARVVHQAPAPG